MSKQIRGIVIEGLPGTGKSLVIAELKRLHQGLMDAEQNTLALSNRYTTAKARRKSRKPLKRKAHLHMLEAQLRLLSSLAPPAPEHLSPYRLHTQGFFFLLEQFHLYHAHRFEDEDTKPYKKLEKSLKKLHAVTVVLIASPETLARRLRARNPKRYRQLSDGQLALYLDKEQANLIRLAGQSRLPTYVIQADGQAWTQYAQQILGYLAKGANKDTTVRGKPMPDEGCPQ